MTEMASVCVGLAVGILASISWNLDAIRRELKRIADALEKKS